MHLFQCGLQFTVDKTIESGLVNHEFIGARSKRFGSLVPLGSGNTLPAIVLLPMRQALVILAADSSPEMDDGNATLSAAIRQGGDACDQRIRPGLETGRG